MSDPVQALLDEQIAYYRARAEEYDRTSIPEHDPFAAQADRIRAALRALDLRGRVLEIAAGTGQWTGLLAETAEELTAIDSSPEMLALNQERTNRPRVRYVVDDAFALPATHGHDVLFFGFFLSHVPPERFDAFWAVVEGQLAPNGRAVFVDEGRHGAWREDWIDEARTVVRRTLLDGTVHRAVKVLWDVPDLAERLTALGWTASVADAGPFYWGVAHR
ncbi:MAG TPA: class I SAM-dependent methyltransferase [Candidatus Limnocylindria bacterium]